MPGVKCVKYIYFKWFSKTKNNIMITKIKNIGDSVPSEAFSPQEYVSATSQNGNIRCYQSPT